MTIQGWPLRRYILLPLVFFILYSGSFFLLYRYLQTETIVTTIIPVSAVAIFFGLRMGLITAMASIPLNLLLLHTRGESPLPAITQAEFIHSYTLIFLASLVAGWMSDTRKKYHIQISLLQKTQEDLKSRTREAEMLRGVASAVASTIELDSLLELILQHLYEVVPYNSACVFLIDGEYMHAVAARGFPDANAVLNRTYALNAPLEREIMGSGAPLIIPDASEDPRFKGWAGTEYVRGWMCVPLKVKGKIIGLVTLDSRKPSVYGDEEARAAQAFADEVAIAINNARLFEQVQKQAITDELTGLYNSRYFFSQLGKEIQRCLRYNRVFSLLMIDLDDFKLYNDRYGHLAGDDLLKELSILIKNGIREMDTPARYGGEEFVIILSETDTDEALVMADRLRVSINKHNFFIEETKQVSHITASMGIATYPKHSDGSRGLVEAADKAMYRAKIKKNTIFVAE